MTLGKPTCSLGLSCPIYKMGAVCLLMTLLSPVSILALFMELEETH